jgi:cytochrome c biogenesis protein CcmG/thiol:disulfide interchange protein DsbE
MSEEMTRGQSEPPEGEDSHRPIPLGLVVLVGVGLLAGVVMAALTLVNPAATLGSSGSGVPTPVPDRVAEGQPAPEFTAVTASGEQVALSDYAGRPVILNFWATWCAPCRVEMPALQAASERYADQGVVVLAVNALESGDQVTEFMDELGLTFPAVLDPKGEIVDLYEVRVFPTTIWIDEQGVVRAEHLGALDDALIDDYLAEISTP